jgi:bla regulator protein BlaR1
MKKIIYIVIMSAMFLLSACNGSYLDSDIDNSVNTVASTEPYVISEMDCYKPVLDALQLLQTNMSLEDYDSLEDREVVGFVEYPYGTTLGYALADLNSDGVSELLLGSTEDLSYAAPSSIFTLKDKKPVLLGSYWNRNCGIVTTDGTIYTVGSGGSAYTYLSSYRLDKDADALTQLTDMRSDYSEVEQKPFYIQVVNGKEEPITDTTFWDFHDKYENPSDLMKLTVIDVSDSIEDSTEVSDDLTMNEANDVDNIEISQDAATTNEVNLSSFFGDYTGSAVFLDSTGNYTFYNASESERRISPRSTFKIISTLAAFEYGIVTPEESIIEWDGTTWTIDSWNKDLSIIEAFQNSCVWYYKELIERIGKDNMANFLETLHYGNEDITQWDGSGLNRNPKIDGFWLESSLLISPREQVDVIRSIFEGKTAINPSSIDSLKQIMRKDNTAADIKIYGKTGTGKGGCYVGFFEADGNNTYFAVYIDEREGADGQKAQIITHEIIQNYFEEEIKEGNRLVSKQEALDIVKKYISDGEDDIFEMQNMDESNLTYHFRNSNYMIQYDNYIESDEGEFYIIHEFEVVTDNLETGEGHTATSNWYKVDAKTGVVQPMFYKDGTNNEDY